MVRVDVFNHSEKEEELLNVDCNFSRDFEEQYDLGEELGKGGFGKVRVAVSKATGKEYACKSIVKRLDLPNLSAQAQAAHLANVEREVKVLRRLQGTLSVCHLEEVFEDNDYVHIVMEYCRGGELLHHISHTPHYTEGMVAEFMRAVLRMLVQCHEHNILHRDIKPGNFLLLDPPDDLRRVGQQRLKAIDFGLAAFFDPATLPRTDLGLEGTPWFMAPEVLSSRFYPASDVWAAGVMTYQLLTGRLPFDDKRNPTEPALSQVWKSILSDPLEFKGKTWTGISDEAKDFICQLLHRDPAKRVSARAALTHPWLAESATAPRAQRPLRHTVVQRIQRFALGVAQGNPLRRSIFELIAQELLAVELASPQVSAHGGSYDVRPAASPRPSMEVTNGFGTQWGPSVAGGDEDLFRLRSMDAISRMGCKSAYGGLHSARGIDGSDSDTWSVGLSDRCRSLESPDNYWRIMRAALAASDWTAGDGKPLAPYVRCMPRTDGERQEQSKAARLALNTSSAEPASESYQRFLAQLQASHSALPPAGSCQAAAPQAPNPEAKMHPEQVASACGLKRTVDLKELREVMHALNFSREAEVATEEAVANGLSKLGYELAPGEMRSLARSFSNKTGDVTRAAFVASQIDWHMLQTNHKEAWLAACRRVFAELAGDVDSTLGPTEDLVRALASKLPEAEIEYAVQDALQAAGHADTETLDFEGFLRLMSQEAPSAELETYDSRIAVDADDAS